MACEDVKCGSK